MITTLIGFTIRKDNAGISSFIRAIGLDPHYYFSLLHLFHSDAVNVFKLPREWLKLCLNIFKPYLYRVNKKILILADGLKAAKEGRKMPAVKVLHQESLNNSKSEFILGHYIESLALLAGNKGATYAIPLTGQIHSGVIFSKEEEKLTVVDRFIKLVKNYLSEISYYLIADAYYVAKKLMKSLISNGNHLLTRMRTNGVVWEKYKGTKKRKGGGRRKLYGRKIYVRKLFNDRTKFKTASSPVYGEKKVEIKYRSKIVILRPRCLRVKLILVSHPRRGKIILATTDCKLDDLEAIKMYGYRFKIEVTFKSAKELLGTYDYHFWMKKMKKIRRKCGDQIVYNKPARYQKQVKRKLKAFTVYIQLGLIAQGLLQYLSLRHPRLVWDNFHSWYRTMKTDKPPPLRVVAMALRDSFFGFLMDLPPGEKWKIFMKRRVDLSRISYTDGLELIKN